MSGHRVVTTTDDGLVRYAQPQDGAHGPLWLTLSAATAGTVVPVATFGLVDEPSWSWTPGQPLYLAADGVLSAAAPTLGILARLAVAVTPTRIFIDPAAPIALAA
jgi:hypothetical protein